jgi:hypothetical protein
MVSNNLGVETLEVDGGNTHLEEVVNFNESTLRSEDTSSDEVEVDITLSLKRDLLVMLNEGESADVGGVTVDTSTNNTVDDVLHLLGVHVTRNGRVETEDRVDLAVVDDRNNNTRLEDRSALNETMVDLTVTNLVHDNRLLRRESLRDLRHLSLVLNTTDVLTGNSSVVLSKLRTEEVLSTDEVAISSRSPSLSIRKTRNTSANNGQRVMKSILDRLRRPHAFSRNLCLDRGNVGSRSHVADLLRRLHTVVGRTRKTSTDGADLSGKSTLTNLASC